MKVEIWKTKQKHFPKSKLISSWIETADLMFNFHVGLANSHWSEKSLGSLEVSFVNFQNFRLSVKWSLSIEK